MELYLLRHADAGDPGAWAGADGDRPLSEKGVRQADRLAVHLLRISFQPDAIVSSPKLRARQTAGIVAAALDREVRVDSRLGGPLSLPILGDILRDAGGPDRVVLVGHDPDFSELLATLVGADAMAMKKGALAGLEVRDGLGPGRAALRWLLPPDLLPRD